MLLLLNLVFCVNSYSQDIKVINTKDLVSISRRVGLDSVLSLVRNIPISSFDSVVYCDLVKEVASSKPSDRVSEFFTQYIMTHYDETFKDDVFEYFSKEKELVKTYKSRRRGGLPIISDNYLLAMVRYSNLKTEGLLCDYYKEWKNKSKEFAKDYERGKEALLGRKDCLQQSFKDCHTSCYKTLKALDLLKSTFPDSIKYKSHIKYVSRYCKKDLSIRVRSFDSGVRRPYPIDTIKLSRPFKSFGDFDVNKIAEFKEMTKWYNDECSWRILVYKEKIAYFDVGSQSGPECGGGFFYWLELLGDTIVVHEIYQWVS